MRRETIDQRLFRNDTIVPKVRALKPDCSICRHSETVEHDTAYAFACKLGYMPPDADGCPDFKDARRPNP